MRVLRTVQLGMDAELAAFGPECAKKAQLSVARRAPMPPGLLHVKRLAQLVRAFKVVSNGLSALLRAKIGSFQAASAIVSFCVPRVFVTRFKS